MNLTKDIIKVDVLNLFFMKKSNNNDDNRRQQLRNICDQGEKGSR